jgi:prevent-host-death family protein
MVVAGQSRARGTWSVQEAKAKLSEVLRRAREEGPQVIGSAHPCVVVPLEAWQDGTNPRPPLGRWLARTTPRGEPLELPDRREPDRRVDLGDPGASR